MGFPTRKTLTEIEKCKVNEKFSFETSCHEEEKLTRPCLTSKEDQNLQIWIEVQLKDILTILSNRMNSDSNAERFLEYERIFKDPKKWKRITSNDLKIIFNVYKEGRNQISNLDKEK